jgi:hypothetical protein
MTIPSNTHARPQLTRKRDPDKAFESAISQGLPEGIYAYKHSTEKYDYFQHIYTKSVINLPIIEK